MQTHADKGIVGADERAAEDADADDHQQKTGAAAGVEPGHGAHILHGEGQPRLIAADGLVLGAVVGKDPAHVLHPGDENHIAQEEEDLQKALHQVAQEVVSMDSRHQAGQERGQEDEESHREGNAQHGGHVDHQLFHLLAADLILQPLVELGRLGVLLFREEGSRVHQRLNAVDHAAGEVYHAADERPAQNGIAILGRLQWLGLHHQPFGAAHHNGLLFGALHQNALDERLAADHGFEFFLCICLFIHDFLYSSPVGREMVTRVPPPGAFSRVRVPPCMVTISSHTARPMPLPRALELPL